MAAEPARTPVETRQCQNCKTQFTIEPDDFSFYDRIKVPPPTWCPECRMVRRMLFRNERTLYWKKCDSCGTNTLSMYSAEMPSPVYCRECWWSDQWDPFSYGRECRFDNPFVSQFQKLLQAVPRAALVHYHTNVNADYSNFISGNRNVYLAYSVVGCENVYYSYSIDKGKDIFDSYFLKNAEACYENILGSSNYRSFYLFKSRDCLDSMFLFDCVNCQKCFMGSNLRNKQYVFRGEQLTKEEYGERLKIIDLGSFETIRKLKEEYGDLTRKSLHKFSDLIKTANCSGDNLSNSKNVAYSFHAYDSENVKYFIRGFNLRDSYDVHGSGGGELIYEGVVTGWNSSRISFFTDADHTQDSLYTSWCHGSKNLFGCVALRNKQYCVLNKQYTKEEYETLIPRIITHMNEQPYVDQQGRTYRYGEFFPPELSPFAYNETIAQEYFPLTKEAAIAQGYRWRDPEPRTYQITKTPDQLPDHIKDVDDPILNDIIQCAHGGKCNDQCTTAFKIIKEELQFYRKMSLPLPRLCPNCRHYTRLKQRNPLKLWHRRCMCLSSEASAKGDNPQTYPNTAKHPHHETGRCPNEFETSYAPDRKEIVYCEACYNAEVV